MNKLPACVRKFPPTFASVQVLLYSRMASDAPRVEPTYFLSLSSPVLSLCFDPGGRLLATGEASGDVGLLFL